MSIDHIILGIISLYPCSGYDMRAEIEKGSVGMLSTLSFGSIYPRLKQLERDGLIEVQQVEAAGRQKKVYELTTLGWQELGRWLEQPPQYPLPMRDDLLLKTLFWGSAGASRETLIAHLRVRREESAGLLRYLVACEQDGVSFIDEYTSLVFSYMKARLEAELTWIAQAITQLEGPPVLPTQDSKWLAVLQKARRTKTLEES